MPLHLPKQLAGTVPGNILTMLLWYHGCYLNLHVCLPVH